MIGTNKTHTQSLIASLVSKGKSREVSLLSSLPPPREWPKHVPPSLNKVPEAWLLCLHDVQQLLRDLRGSRGSSTNTIWIAKFVYGFMAEAAEFVAFAIGGCSHDYEKDMNSLPFGPRCRLLYRQPPPLSCISRLPFSPPSQIIPIPYDEDFRSHGSGRRHGRRRCPCSP